MCPSTDRMTCDLTRKAAAFALLVGLLALPVLAAAGSGNQPLAPPVRPATMVDRVLTNPEIQLSLIVLAFGGLLMVLEVVVALRSRFSDESVIRMMILTLVIVATLFTVTAGFSKEDIAPVIGLFGTIIGYLLGRQTNAGRSAAGDRS